MMDKVPYNHLTVINKDVVEIGGSESSLLIYKGQVWASNNAQTIVTVKKVYLSANGIIDITYESKLGEKADINKVSIDEFLLLLIEGGFVRLMSFAVNTLK